MTTVADVLGRTWRENRLFGVLLELTYRCNLDCFFCYNDLGLRGEPLSLVAYRQLLDDLAALGVLNLTLSGGEPLAHPDFFAVGAHARERGFVVRVKSNGHALRGALARRLRDEVDPFLIEVSLHGATGPTHDRQTRVTGSFIRLLANLEEMLALGLRVKLNSTLTAWNEAEVEAMFALADRLGVPLQFDPEVTVRDDGDRTPLGIAASADGMRNLFRLLRERGLGDQREHADGAAPAAEAPLELAPAPGGKHCGAGSAGLAIDPYGNVYPCVQWRRPVGNLHQQRVGEIWRSSTGLAEVRELTGLVHRKLAALGPRSSLMNFCPGTAASVTGDPTALYDAAVRRMEIADEVRTRSRALLPILPG
jgi:MoaA/NifB/PqqE/SkfB family radical SAM enzyme